MSDGRPGRLVRGAIAGVAAWWAMDRVLRVLYDREDPRAVEREAEARDGIPALERAAEKTAAFAGRNLPDRERQAGGTVVQWAMGIGAGVVYGAVRESLPFNGVSRGLFYGAAFSIVVDEGLTPILGLTPGPAAFPWQTHARGFTGHLVFGVVAELTMQALTRIECDR